MTYRTDSLLFRPLTATERAQFEQHARETDPPRMDSWQVFHPVCRAVWMARGLCPDDVRIARENAT
jgi:hypothetical protein